MFKLKEIHMVLFVFACLVCGILYTEYRKRHPSGAPETTLQRPSLSNPSTAQPGPAVKE